MAWFSKEPVQPVDCPLCGTTLTGRYERSSHFESHTYGVPWQRQGPNGFTFSCTCGPAGILWHRQGGAASGLEYHLVRAHGMPVCDKIIIEIADEDPGHRPLRHLLS